MSAPLLGASLSVAPVLCGVWVVGMSGQPHSATPPPADEAYHSSGAQGRLRDVFVWVAMPTTSAREDLHTGLGEVSRAP